MELNETISILIFAYLGIALWIGFTGPLSEKGFQALVFLGIAMLMVHSLEFEKDDN